MTPHLRARGLACGRRRGVPILSGVDLLVPDGSRTALVGPNGAGKSTLIRALAGLDPLMGGEVYLHERPFAALSRRELARAMAVVPQHSTPPADLTVRELVSLGRLPHRSPWSRDRGDEHALRALERVGLDDFADRPVDQISGGELRRVLLARALAQDTSLLILDEPTNHLDLRHQHELLQLVGTLGVTVVAAMHDLDLAARYFDQIAIVHRGGVTCGPPSELLTSELVADVFGVQLTRIHNPNTGADHLVIDPLPNFRKR